MGAPTRPKPRIRVVAAVIEEDGSYLITQRRSVAALPLLWEFPGGRVEPGESDGDALAREIRHRLGVTVQVGNLISFVSHQYERYSVDLHLYSCTISGGSPRPINVNAFEWVDSESFEDYPFTPADEASVSILLGIH